MLDKLRRCELFNNITTDIGGVQVESLQNYNTMIALQYSKLPSTNQTLLGETESFKKQTEMTKSAGAYTYGRDI